MAALIMNDASAIRGTQRTGWKHNRGISFYEGKLFAATWDGRLFALDADTGKELWMARTFDIYPGAALCEQPEEYPSSLIAWDPVKQEAVWELWNFDMGLGMTAAPITYELNGKQYVSMLVGWGGGSAGLGSLFSTEKYSGRNLGWD